MSNLLEINVPAARVDSLVITESRDEVLVYDTQRHHIHHLNQTSAVVWRLCDGRRSMGDIVRKMQVQLGSDVSEATVKAALTKLDDANLLEGSLGATMRAPAQSRRAFLRKAGVAGAIAIPTIISISAPAAAGAVSGVCPGFGPPVLEDQCESMGSVGQCCCDDPGAPDEDCGICGLAPGDDEDDDLKCLNNEN